MAYTINKFKDTYTINNTGLNVINYTIRKYSVHTTVPHTPVEGTILLGASYEIVFNGDGQYEIDIIDGAELSIITIKYYLELQLSMIEDIFSVICDCECGCNDCQDLDISKCKALIIAKTKLDTYKKLMNPSYTGFLNIVDSYAKDLVEPDTYCLINNEKINGLLPYNEKLFLKFIAYDYLAFYYYELESTNLLDEITYIKSKFKIDRMLCCIGKLGIDLKEIESLIENNMGTVLINSTAYINQRPESIGDYTIAVPNRAVTILTLAMFTTLTTPPYVDPEGDPVDAVRIDTLPSIGQLKLNGVLVTPGQIISVVDINLGLLTYDSPLQDDFGSDTFNFSLRDTGSGLFNS